MTLNPSPSFNTFWSWWWPSITAWLPTRLKERLNPAPKRMLLHWNEVSQEIATNAPDEDADAVLLLPASCALIRPLTLPATARTRLTDILCHEISRQTPFSADQVYFDGVVEQAAQGANAKLRALLVVVPRATLEAAVASTKPHTGRLVRVDVVGEDRIPVGANLLPAVRRYRPPQRWRRWNIALLLVCVIAAFGALTGFLHARQRAVDTFEQKTRSQLTHARSVERRERALRHARTLSGASIGLVRPSALTLIEELSKTLPLDSYFIQIEIKGDVITARGQTTDLSAVLRALGNAEDWGTPRLTGSRKLPDGKQEEFSLRLQLHHPASAQQP